MKKLFYIIFLICSQNLFAQEDDREYLGTWNILNIKANINPKWSVFGEAQLRSLRTYKHFHYYELKTGFNYKINSFFSFSLGVGDFNTYQTGGSFVNPKQNSEIRIWQQLTITQKLERLKFEHRYRAEQRYRDDGSMRNRFRYRASMNIPLNKDKKQWYLNFSDEIFFTDVQPYFERNRFFVGIGHHLRQDLTIQAGWLYQFDYKLTDETGYNFLQISLLFDLYFKEKSEPNPQLD